jgi:DNA-binding protein YbaB
MADQDVDLDRALIGLQRWQAEFERAQQELKNKTVVGRSRDRLVTVRVRALGGIASVKFDSAIFDDDGYDEESLAAAVMDAIAEASARATKVCQKALGSLEVLPELAELATGVDDEEELPTHEPEQAAAPSVVRPVVPDVDPAGTPAAAAAASWAVAGMGEQEALSVLGRRSMRAKVESDAEAERVVHGQAQWSD